MSGPISKEDWAQARRLSTDAVAQELTMLACRVLGLRTRRQPAH